MGDGDDMEDLRRGDKTVLASALGLCPAETGTRMP